ncbi:MAG: VWA domain-containing protein [Acidobacteria bacterium]|nr:VWA domain-containing protein [Acidobacteriota bacterium]
MLLTALSLKRLLCALWLCVCVLAGAAQGQTPSGQSDEVVRISSTIFQTDVMVFDKQGRFVENLQREQFELRVDGKVKPISFFERVKAGSIQEDAQLAAARGVQRTASTSETGAETIVPLDRGRAVLFYIDDLHLSSDSIQRVRAMLLNFLDKELGQNDAALISSASGQVGFLQQLTGDKAVLRAAIERLQPRTNLTRDFESPPMSEQQALLIEKYHQDVIDFFADRLQADNPFLPREVAVQMVHRRAEAFLHQVGGVTSNTLTSLNNLIRLSGQIEGRKLLFFISDGFLIDDQTSNVTTSLHRIADAAARASVIIYSIDARGLTSGAADATTNVTVDPTQRLTRESGGEVTATQQPLRTLALDTGGRPLFNTNSLSTVATTALKETSVYYLLAWRPEDDQPDNKFRRIEVSVVGRPDLVVRVRRGFLDQPEEKAVASQGGTTNAASRGKDARTSTQEALLQAIRTSQPSKGLPTSLFATYADAPNIGTYINASMEIETDALAFTETNGKQVATVDIGGIVFDTAGKAAVSFQSQLLVNPPGPSGTNGKARRGVVYTHQAKLKPGLYQVRVAARDSKSGRVGSAMQWLQIPDLATRRLNLSSVLIGESTPALTIPASETRKDAGESPDVFFSVSRRFARNSRLRFLMSIYNAARSTDAAQMPDVALQVQILRDNQPVLTTALSKVETRGVQDLTRLPYAAEIPLDSMPAGRYLLQVVVIDRIAKTSATQYVTFEIG